MVAIVATPFHCSSGSLLGFETSAPSISPAASSPINSALTAPPSCTSSMRAEARTAKLSTTAPSPSAGGPPVIFQ